MNIFSHIEVNYDILAFVHLLVNLILFGICICRLAAMYKGVLRRVKAQYVLMAVLSLANGCAPIFFQQWPTGVSVLFAAGVLFMMWTDSYAWRHGVPKAAVVAPPSDAHSSDSPEATNAQ